MTAAIEVKRLLGDIAFREYSQSITSLTRRLAPPCGGTYYLDHLGDPSSALFDPPLDKRLVRLLKNKIAQLAPSLPVDGSASFRVNWQGRDEEWELIKTADETRGVWALALHEGDVRSSVENCLQSAFKSAQPKFLSKRWADLHVLTLETSWMVPADMAAQVVAAIEASWLRGIDLILLADNDRIIQLHPPEGVPMTLAPTTCETRSEARTPLPAHPEPVEGRAERHHPAHGSTGSPRAGSGCTSAVGPSRLTEPKRHTSSAPHNGKEHP